MTEKLAELPVLLLPWFQENQRKLPWREDRNPYHIWVSEIMLQQTRVEAVKGYYARFLDVNPDIQSLANCDDELLSKLWEGLGYYSRVRNLKKAAQEIMTLHGGQFPGEYEAVRKLPGIGDYTAGAVCSIAFDLPTPAVDGNVLRVLARILDDGRPIDSPEVRKEYRSLLTQVYPEEAGNFTQALMELGATLCGPNKAPDCAACPCKDICTGYKNGTAFLLPVKLPKKERKEELLTVFIMRCGDRFAIRKRQAAGLLASLWEFPNTTGTLSVPQAMQWVQNHNLTPMDIHKILNRQHIFTHVKWQMEGIYLDVKNENQNYVWMNKDEIDGKIALPTAFRQFWTEADHV